MLIKDVMTPLPFTVRPSMSVLEARAEMDRRRFRHLLVVDEAGLLVGIATDRDIRLNLPSPATSLSVWEINYLVGRLTVGDVMTHTVLTVDPDRDVRSAARILIDHKIGALPVLDGAKLVGIVTDTDLLRALATSPEFAAAAS
jgi:acetoin utilization protein AcuB